MKCYIKTHPDVAQSKKFKLVKGSSDIGQERNTNGPNVFFYISPLNLAANTFGYIQSDNQFDIMPDKQKLLSMASIILVVMKKC